MDDSAHKVLLRIVRDLPDPRQAWKVSHKLHDILVIVVCATIAGLEHFTEFEDYAEANAERVGRVNDPPSFLKTCTQMRPLYPIRFPSYVRADLRQQPLSPSIFTNATPVSGIPIVGHEPLE
jgi:hypothetical protein